MRRSAGQFGLRIIVCLLTMVSTRLACRPAQAQELQKTRLLSDNPHVFGGFGQQVAVDGTTVLIGARDGGDGAVYIYTRTGTNTWNQQAKLVPTVSSEAPFGYSVAISGDTILVGGSSNSNQVAVYVYVRSGVSWTRQATLSGPSLSGFFSMAIDRDVAVIGTPNAVSGSGAAHIFERTGTSWTYVTSLRGSAPFARFEPADVDVSGDTILVGAPWTQVEGFQPAGHAYVFVRASASSWTLQATLLNTRPDFGTVVSLDGNTAFAGGPSSSEVFARTGSSWQSQIGLGSGLANGPIALDVSGDRFVLAGENSGEAYMYARSGVSWTRQVTLLSETPTPGGAFGAAVAISGGTFVIGEPGANAQASRSGAAYIFGASPAITPVPALGGYAPLLLAVLLGLFALVLRKRAA